MTEKCPKCGNELKNIMFVSWYNKIKLWKIMNLKKEIENMKENVRQYVQRYTPMPVKRIKPIIEAKFQMMLDIKNNLSNKYPEIKLNKNYLGLNK